MILGCEHCQMSLKAADTLSFDLSTLFDLSSNLIYSTLRYHEIFRQHAEVNIGYRAD